MMVLDASLALAYAMPDEDSVAAESAMHRLEDAPALAPTVWIYEVASALRVGQLRNRLTADVAHAVLTTLKELHIEFEHPDGDQLLLLSRETGLTVYDSSYLALCLKHRLPLASLDQRLVAVAREQGIEVLP